MKKKIQTLNLSEKVLEKLKEKAKQEDRSVSWLANKILEEKLHA